MALEHQGYLHVGGCIVSYRGGSCYLKDEKELDFGAHWETKVCKLSGRHTAWWRRGVYKCIDHTGQVLPSYFRESVLCTGEIFQKALGSQRT